jgi:hypothetical protein
VDAYSNHDRQLRAESCYISYFGKKLAKKIREALTVLRIPNPVSGAFLTHGSVMGKKSGSGMSYEQFLGLRYLNSLMWIRDAKNSDPG